MTAGWMTEGWLLEQEERLAACAAAGIGPIWMRTTIPDLIAEVRRLRRENHLLNLSRGVPSAVGLD